MGKYLVTALTCNLCLAFTSTHALAEKKSAKKPSKAPKIAVLSLEISGDGPAELRTTLDESLAKGLGKKGNPVNGLAKTLKRLASSPELIGCSSSDCLERISGVTGATLFVRALVKADGANYEISLERFSASSPSPLQVESSCAVCTIPDLAARVEEAGSQLISSNQEKEDIALAIKISSTPEGSDIFVNSQPKGKTPISLSLPPGEHQVEARKEGYRSQKTTLRLEADREPTPLEIKLEALPKPSEPRFATWKWVGALTAGGLVATGGVLLYLDGEAKGDTRGERYNTFPQAAASLGLGLVVGAAAGWMFWSDKNTQNSDGLSASVMPGGAQASFRYSF